MFLITGIEVITVRTKHKNRVNSRIGMSKKNETGCDHQEGPFILLNIKYHS